MLLKLCWNIPQILAYYASIIIMATICTILFKIVYTYTQEKLLHMPHAGNFDGFAKSPTTFGLTDLQHIHNYGVQLDERLQSLAEA